MMLSIHLPSEHSIGKLLFGGSHTCSPKCQHTGILGQLERKSYLFFLYFGVFLVFMQELEMPILC